MKARILWELYTAKYSTILSTRATSNIRTWKVRTVSEARIRQYRWLLRKAAQVAAEMRTDGCIPS